MPKRKIVISEIDNIAAIIEDDRAVEFIIHRGDILLGDVFLASVENILPSIDAAFVNVGSEKMGFLHSSDVPGRGDLKNRLEPKQQLVVQVMKEPTGHKGPRVTTNITLPGRFLVMMPESKGISISRKIMDPKERARLKSIVSLIKPAGVGVIIRTEANLQKESDIQEDFETLIERWQNIVSMADTASPPTLLYRDQDLLYRVIREAVTEDAQEIIVDSAFGLQRAQQLLQTWNMDKNIKVSQYAGSQPILVGTGVDREIKQALQTKVPLPSGGYLYIQPTEALTVVDVNSGKFTSLDSQAETIKQTNLEACKEIARQLRLRNIGGMIIVDFIDMESRADQLKILETFEMELAPDKSKPQIGQLSDLGLVEMTRHRQGQALSEIFTKKCIACNGTGHALEEFAWGPAHSHQDQQRGPGRHMSMRHKLPVKQSRSQQVPRPAASAHNNQRTSNRPAAPVVPGSALAVPGGTPASDGLSNSMLLARQAQQAGKGRPLMDRPIADYLEEKLHKEFGIYLANVAKLAYTPAGTNAILARINPRANDVLTLVNSIVDGTSISAPSVDDEETTKLTRRGAEKTEDEKSEDFDEADESADEEQLQLIDEEESSDEEVEKPRRGRLSKKSEEPVAEESEEIDADEVEVDAVAEADEEEPETVETQKPAARRRGRPPKRSRSSKPATTKSEAPSSNEGTSDQGEHEPSPAGTTRQS